MANIDKQLQAQIDALNKQINDLDSTRQGYITQLQDLQEQLGFVIRVKADPQARKTAQDLLNQLGPNISQML